MTNLGSMKWTVLLMLACLQVTAQSDYVIFESGNFKGLKTAEGQELLAPTYDDLGWTNGNRMPVEQLIGYQVHEKWGLISLDGKRITAPLYDKLEVFLPGIYKVAVQGKFTNRYFYGLVNDKGKLLLNLDYFEIDQRGEAVVVTLYEKEEFRLGAFSKVLARIAETKYVAFETLGNVLVAKLPSGYLDVINTHGALLETKLEEATLIKDQVITRRAGKVGLITADGKVIHPPIHKSIDAQGSVQPFPNWTVRSGATSFDIRCDSLQELGMDVWLLHFNEHYQLYARSKSFTEEGYRLIQKADGYAVMQSASSGDYIGLNGRGEQVIISDRPILFDRHYFILQSGKQYSVHQRTGKQISDKTFEQVQSLSSQYLGVKKFGYWAIMDGIQRFVSDFRYDSIASVAGFSAVVKYVGKWGVYHPDRNWIIHPDYERIVFVNDQYVAEKGRAFHLFDADGQLLFQTIDQIVPTSDFFMLKYENRVSALGANGRAVANTEYTSVSKWGDYFELNRGDTTELYTSTGRRMLGARDQVQDVAGFAEGLFLIKKADRYGFVDESGKLRIANRYDAARPFSEGLAPVMIRGKWGFIDLSEKLVIQPYYQHVSAFSNGVAIVDLGGKTGLINREGNEIVNADYEAIERSLQGNFILKQSSGAYGFADASGVVRLSASFEQIEDVGNNTLRIQQNGQYGLFDYTGRNKIPIQFSEIKLGKEAMYLKLD